MKCVYLLESLAQPERRYVGITSNLQQRLEDNNFGKSPHTSEHKPWRLVVAISFEDGARAGQFERYLKTGAGRAFANRHFW